MRWYIFLCHCWSLQRLVGSSCFVDQAQKLVHQFNVISSNLLSFCFVRTTTNRGIWPWLKAQIADIHIIFQIRSRKKHVIWSLLSTSMFFMLSKLLWGVVNVNGMVRKGARVRERRKHEKIPQFSPFIPSSQSYQFESSPPFSSHWKLTQCCKLIHTKEREWAESTQHKILF